LKVITLSKSRHFINVANLTCMELDCSLVNVTTKEQVVNLLSNHKINLILIDCDTYRPINFNILEFIQNINKNTYCLIVETSIHEIDKDALLAQITKQCMLQEIYSYQLFVKHFYNNYLSETEKTILLKEDLSNNKKDNFENNINYDDLFTVDENGIAIIKDLSPEYFTDSIVLGFGEEFSEKEEELESGAYMGLEPNCIKILEFLKANLNKPVSITSICNHIWGECNKLKKNAIYVYIRKIRMHLGDNLDIPTKLLKSAKGYSMIIMYLTDIVRKGSYVLYCESAIELLKDTMENEEIYQGIYMPGILSRKKQIIPELMKKI